jgi:hypothetical protein
MVNLEWYSAYTWLTARDRHLRNGDLVLADTCLLVFWKNYAYLARHNVK